MNTKIALTLNNYQGNGSWNTVHLDQDLNSADRLWRHHKSDTTWNV
ncbi:hypothetical protein [Streptomyces sp. NBC_01353]|nr:hypothetical protein [Streptomyces sp. NBC_01353]